ncbi:PAQR family membrane homeostasis protein TrhA [Nocardioides sp.]|uniref:PAQR family membrane homeostasis protein TrhA n=1 Tax=Nocardioides sp. TaxID=35761 RepID=UPI003D10B20B
MTIAHPPIRVSEAAPHLRGWLHTAAAPLALAAGVVLIALSPSPASRIGSTVFALAALINFTASATLHRGNWAPRVALILRRIDHASIFVLIAGSYTPFALIMLSGQPRVALLAVAWSGAALGILSRLFWIDAPRWIYTATYLALGWAAVFFVKDFISYPGANVVPFLILLGGALYTMGAIVYGTRRPNPIPRWFGFHEVFHLLALTAFATHYVGVSIATYSLR